MDAHVGRCQKGCRCPWCTFYNKQEPELRVNEIYKKWYISLIRQIIYPTTYKHNDNNNDDSAVDGDEVDDDNNEDYDNDGNAWWWLLTSVFHKIISLNSNKYFKDSDVTALEKNVLIYRSLPLLKVNLKLICQNMMSHQLINHFCSLFSFVCSQPGLKL